MSGPISPDRRQPSSDSLVDGDLVVRDRRGRTRVRLDADTGALFTHDGEGEVAYQYGGAVGGIDRRGALLLKARDAQEVTILLDPRSGVARLGGNEVAGRLVCRDAGANSRISLDGGDGTLEVRDAAGRGILTFNPRGDHAHLGVGHRDRPGRIELFDGEGRRRIALNADESDITLESADCAEDFAVAEDAPVEPGTVVRLDNAGEVTTATAAYDPRVAGVVSGAGRYKPALVLDRRPASAPGTRVPVALLGKVMCLVDAAQEPIGVGDLLTTSSTPGHAMRAGNHRRAFGAVLGKALAPLSAGRALIPVLVALR